MTENARHPIHPQESPALIVGFSIHGLALARALARRGVTVHCLSEDETPPQATVRTRYAKVHFRRGLNSGPLTKFLLEVADEIGSPHKIVLFPTSDRIAKGIANGWHELSGRYLLSWSDCRELVLELQRKDSLAAYCERSGVAFPRSRVLQSAADCEAVAQELRFPLVVKPAQPLSSFKALRVRDPSGLRQCVAGYPADLPFVVQEWVEGPEPSLYSCTSYLDHGKPLYMFTSRKIAAYPPGLGQGTVFETVEDPQTQEIAAQFLSQLDLSGPVAVEFKRDSAGKFWLIEPNVGRTEYCVDLAIQSGFNLPYIEYLHAAGRSAEICPPSTTQPSVWFDTDKDPTCFVVNWRTIRGPAGQRRKVIFPFLGHGDWRPVGAALLRRIAGWLRGARRRIGRLTRPVEA